MSSIVTLKCLGMHRLTYRISHYGKPIAVRCLFILAYLEFFLPTAKVHATRCAWACGMPKQYSFSFAKTPFCRSFNLNSHLHNLIYFRFLFLQIAKQSEKSRIALVHPHTTSDVALCERERGKKKNPKK